MALDTVFQINRKVTPVDSMVVLGVVFLSAGILSAINSDSLLTLMAIPLALVISLLLGAGATYFVLSRILKRDHQRQLDLIDKVLEGQVAPIKNPHFDKEILVLVQRINEINLQLSQTKGELEALKKTKSDSQRLREVAHDIRSPLSALNMLTSNAIFLPEEPRLLVRSAVQRISDIAAQLLEKKDSELRLISVNAFVERIVNEKRLEFKHRPEVKLDFHFNEHLNLYIFANSTELARTLSNLINNSYDAITRSFGNIKIEIQKNLNFVSIVISDDGKGIPREILARVGQNGFTYGKETPGSGHGLGLYHAKKTIEASKGVLQILSNENHGTVLVINLPLTQTPSWVCETVNYNEDSVFVTVDDDPVIHDIWKTRLTALGHTPLRFSSPTEFVSWYSAFGQKERCLILLDQEFLGFPMSGLDIIEDLKLQKQTYLVTSSFDCPQLQKRANALGVKVMPKLMASMIKIESRARVHGPSAASTK